MAAIALTMAGFSALFIIALPPNKFRLSVVVGMLLISIIGIYVDGTYLNGVFLNIEMIRLADVLWIALSTFIATIVNIFLRKAVEKIDIKYGDKIHFKPIDLRKIFRKNLVEAEDKN